MNSEDFVGRLKHHVRDAAVEDTISNLRQPPGRHVQSSERARSEWYNALPTEQRMLVDNIIRTVAHQAVFGFLAVLDGTRTIDPAGGHFELAHLSGQRVVLNDPRAVPLHDLLNAER